MTTINRRPITGTLWSMLDRREFVPTPEFEEEVLARKQQVQRAWRRRERLERMGVYIPKYRSMWWRYIVDPRIGWEVPEAVVVVDKKPTDEPQLCDCPYWMHELRNNE